MPPVFSLGSEITTTRTGCSSLGIPHISEVIDISVIDPILTRKMARVNEAIDEIGMTPFQWKLFFLNGFGYGVDSLLISCQSIVQSAVTQEFDSPNPRIKGVALASQVGLLVGAATWGFTADVIGRKWVLNSSLFISIYSAGAGGNYILDATNFLEFLPVSHAWLVSFLAVWWAVGYTITRLLAWAFMATYSCASDVPDGDCPRAANMDWQYLHFTCGTLVIVMALLRVTLVRLVQTPKWLISQNRDVEVVDVLSTLAQRYDLPYTLTLSELQELGRVQHTGKSVWSATRLRAHLSGLVSTRRLAYSTVMIIINWLLIGTLESRGADTGDTSTYDAWRDYAIDQISGLAGPGPAIAGILVEIPGIGRRGTLAIGAAIPTALQFGYTQIKTPAQNLGLSAAITAASDIYYATGWEALLAFW
ncbi:hypothetical protein BO70DRAFT_373322 [Aspergillus heteromorphus CBS 117.55]|uniref:MFS general substrate transporter n=1 Tax=Aspergillus heteromorphus CBS 117.55 TaxID=1448321 RepID=A0A317VGI8_9EURO|nr:uncharacterized protein BO70DRAFT_373322 [Aspergillus heteromorphus CBS 117.55]PWY73035.1 hypothetical protein BO70DRAFT_373322 [Aspergillus heteromorphus CBS 117.55]